MSISLLAGVTVGVAWAIAGLTSTWLFLAEMFSVLVGGTVVIFAQCLLAAMAASSLGVKHGLLVGAMFVGLDPGILLITMCTALAAAWVSRRIHWPWRDMRDM